MFAKKTKESPVIMKTPLLFIFLFISVRVLSQQIPFQKVQNTVNDYSDKNGFSGTVLIAENGQTVFHQSYGIAHKSITDCIKGGYHFSIASITKLFTSIRILQLVHLGKLELDKPVVRYLPRFESFIPISVTPHHLLLHISGLNEEKSRHYRQHFSPEELLMKVLKKKSKYSIGEFNYNNMDYLLLGLLIEELTGNKWQDEIVINILQPIGMTETGFLSYGNYPQQFAYSFSEKRKHLRPDPLIHIENFFAAGSMYATAKDLLTLDQALYGDQLLSEHGKALLSKSYPEYNYTGYGVWNYNYPFVEQNPTVMERRGGILGVNVVLVRLTDQNYTIIILSNDDRFNPDSFGDEHNLREMLIRAFYR